MDGIDALQAIERGDKLEQSILRSLHQAKLIDVGSLNSGFVFAGFTPQGLRLLKERNYALVSDLEKQIINTVVRAFLDHHEATSARILLKQFKSPIATALRRLVDRGVLEVVNNTYLNETYLPKAIAFFHCGDSAALIFARRSTEIVLRVLPILFDRQLDSPQGGNQRQFTSVEVENEGRSIESSVEPNMIFTGLFLAQEFSVFSGLRRDNKQVGIVSFSLGERVYETAYLDWDEHIQRSNTSLVYDLEHTRSGSSPVGPGTPSTRPLNLERLLPRIDSDSNKVFLVHGHAEEPKQDVATFLRTIGVDVIILHEKPNQGLTIIEKFEKHSGVSFAVVLLTPDDVGGPANSRQKMSLRARQNVILELGYFLAKLGRNRVCCLYVKGVELPSDYDGVLYVPYDSGDWQAQLAKELIAAGIEVESVLPVELGKKARLAHSVNDNLPSNSKVDHPVADSPG